MTQKGAGVGALTRWQHNADDPDHATIGKAPAPEIQFANVC